MLWGSWPFQPKCTGVLTQGGADPGGLWFKALPTQPPFHQISHPGGHAPDTKKAKVASCLGTCQEPSLDAQFGLFLVPEAPGALFDKIQAQILGALCLRRSRRFWLKLHFAAL